MMQEKEARSPPGRCDTHPNLIHVQQPDCTKWRANPICPICGEYESDRPHYMSEDFEKLRKQVPKLERRIAVLEAELRRLSRIISSESHTFERISKLLSSSFTPNSCRGCNLGFPLSEDGKFHEYPTSGRKHSRCLLGLIS